MMPSTLCALHHLILTSTLEMGNAIIPVLQMSKLTPEEEAHGQLPKVHQFRTGIKPKPTL